MQLFDRHGKKYLARKVKRPRFRSIGRGARAWDYEAKKLDGVERQFWLDRGRGFRFYFQHRGTWYALHFWKGNEDECDAFDVAEFYTAPTNPHP